jgi:hypothetical protein
MSAKITITIPEWLDRICAWPVTVYRKKKYGYAYRRIYLGEGRFTMVEPADFYWLNNYHWSTSARKERPYAVRYAHLPKDKIKTISMHREIMNFPAERLVDHENGDTLDNRRDNLRIATSEQNAYNKQKTKSKTSSRFIGVYFEKQKSRWIVRIKYKENRIYLGCFKDEIEAARAYDAGAKKYHGEFARLNFPNLTAETAPC